MKAFITDQDLRKIMKQLEIDSDQPVDFELPKLEDRNDVVGKIAVKNQKIIVCHQSNGGQMPVIEAEAPVRLKINGSFVEGPVAVGSTDHIEWEIEQQPLFLITVSKDQMTAYFHLLRKERYAWTLCDQEASSHLILRAIEDKTRILETLQLSTILKELEVRSIKQNLQLSNIEQELSSPTYLPILIAKGKEPVHGTDARLEVYFQEKVQNVFEEVEGMIDFRNRLKIPQAQKGEIIARKYPVIEGSNGYNVFGKIISYAPPKDVIVVFDHRKITMTEDGHIIALIEGRPRIRGERVKMIDITSSFIVSGDLDFATGNILFSGDVIVFGNVMDDMVIESLGNVYVYGNVYNSTITATGSIYIKGNVLNSNIYSGFFGVVFNRLYMNSKKMLEMLQNTRIAAKQLMDVLKERGSNFPLGRVIRTIIEAKYSDFSKITHEVLQLIDQLKNKQSSEIHQKLEKVKNNIHQINVHGIQSYDELEAMITSLLEIRIMIEGMQENDVMTQVGQSNYSNLKSNGDIMIRNEGTLNSNLYSRGNIVYFRRNATCRGGTLEAEQKILGSIVEGSSIPVIKAGDRISFHKINSAKICIGRLCELVTVPYENFEAFIDHRHLVIKGDQSQDYLGI